LKETVVTYLEALSQQLIKGIEKNHEKPLITVVGVPIEIRTRYLLNESQKPYRLSELVHSTVIVQVYNVKVSINALQSNSSVNTVQHATIVEAVSRVRGDVTQLWAVVT
jgi:hypothetical protein